MMKHSVPTGISVALLLAASTPGLADEFTPEQLDFFETKIRPVLVESCYECHSVESGTSKAGLVLDSRAGMLEGGDGGPAIIPGKPDESLLIQAVRFTDDDFQMPPTKKGGKLPDEVIANFEAWVLAGAPDPRNETKLPPAKDFETARKHWAFQPIARPEIPEVTDREWVATPVDQFVLAGLDAAELTPNPPADKHTLLRRVTYGITGLPPTPEEMEAFLADNSPDAYERVVDRLLDSPAYGERWGRYWLDVARYADTKGYLAGGEQRRYSFSHTYRDYVIQAFNEDKPFDEFIVEQLAADHLELDEDKSALAAMGYLTLGRRFLNNPHDIIDDRIDVVTRGMLGLTVSCARCHDHKFDPVPTADYYSLYGVFASSEEPDEKPLLGELDESDARYQSYLQARQDVQARSDEVKNKLIDEFITEQRKKSAEYMLGAVAAGALPENADFGVFAGEKKLHADMLKRWIDFLESESTRTNLLFAPWFAAVRFSENTVPGESGSNSLAASAELISTRGLQDIAHLYGEALTKSSEDDGALIEASALRELVIAGDGPANPPREEVARWIRRDINEKTSQFRREIEALNWTHDGAPLRAMALVDRPEPRKPVVFLRGKPGNNGPEVERQFLEVLAGPDRKPFEKGSGRLDLAQAIASPENPLTARVFVNRVWGWHFGKPLVDTPSDFGLRTEKPVHAAMLDWLASEFMANDWSTKHLHRLIVLSNTFQQSSDERELAELADPENHLLHKFNRRRLSFEAFRDSLLTASGELDRTMGGLPVTITEAPFSPRRTVYGYIDRQNLPGLFRTFDFPNPDASSPGRFTTTVPQQALYMLNSPFVIERAKQLAGAVESEPGAEQAKKVEMLYNKLFQRDPSEFERAIALEFLSGSAAKPESVAPNHGWQYGFGSFDQEAGRVTGFQEFEHAREDRRSMAPEFPSQAHGHLCLTASGGHPGIDGTQAAIRRWTAPMSGSVRIRALLKHPAEQGDGVRARLVSSSLGLLGEWTAHHSELETTIDSIEVRPGDTIDFVADCVSGPGWDSFEWAPEIAFLETRRTEMDTKTTWSARDDFGDGLDKIVQLSPLERYAQVLLLSNEFAFVD